MLEALRLLLKGEGFEIESAHSPAGILAALESRDFDVVLMDLNYTRDTTSGQEGLDLLARIQAMDSTVAGGRDDRVGQRRSGGGSDAPRRARLHPEAVGQRAAADHRAHAGGTERGAASAGQRLEAENRLLRDGRTPHADRRSRRPCSRCCS